MAKILLLLFFVGVSLQDEIIVPVVGTTRESCAGATDKIVQKLDALQRSADDAAKVDSCQDMKSSITSELVTIKRNMELQINKTVNSDIKESIEQMTSSLKELQNWITLEFASIRAQMKNLSCIPLRLKMGGEALTKLSTGVYYFHNEYMSHSDASEWCKKKEMQLAQLETPEEMKELMDNAPSAYHWLGASNVGSKSGEFHWSDGGRVAAELWSSGHPLNLGDKDSCVYLYPEKKKIASHFCDNSWRPLCEVGPEFSGCF